MKRVYLLKDSLQINTYENDHCHENQDGHGGCPQPSAIIDSI